MLDAFLSFVCDLNRGVERTLIRPVLLTGDSQAHTFRIAVKRGGAEEAITGAGVAAYFVRADGVTVPVTGRVEGTEAVVTLPESCYRAPGRFQLVIKLSLNGAISTVFWGDGAVAASDTDAILDEEGVIPSLDELLAKVAAVEAAAADADSAASSAGAAADRANRAAAAIEAISAEAATLAPGSDATASVTTVDGVRVIHIGVPQGIQGPKGDPGKDGSGSVTTVNGVGSVGGNVTLTAADVGALPDTYTPPVTSVNGETGDVVFATCVDLLAVYPVGSIYMSVSDVSPASLFGGMWEQIEDRFLLAAGSTYAAGSTGGEAAHMLTVSEMPSHAHNIHASYPDTPDGTETNGKILSGSKDNAWVYNHATTTTTGGGLAHNNMPPYLAVYVWKRVG